MALSIPSKIVWGWTQTILSPLSVVGAWLNTGKTLGGMIADTWRLLLNAIKDPFSKETYKTYGSRISGGYKTFKADNKAWWKRFWAPYEGKRDQAYGVSKLTSYPTHAIYWWIKYWVWTVFDTARRAAATPFTFTGNMFLKKENRVKLWKEWWKNNMKKRRWSYGDGFKQLKKSSEWSDKKSEAKKEEKTHDKKPEDKPKAESQWPDAETKLKIRTLETENKKLQATIEKLLKEQEATKAKLEKILSDKKAEWWKAEWWKIVKSEAAPKATTDTTETDDDLEAPIKLDFTKKPKDKWSDNEVAEKSKSKWDFIKKPQLGHDELKNVA